MKLQTVTLQNYRNHAQSTIHCGEATNALVGDNGEGKTNVLEGISYLCLTKSFFGNSDRTALQREKNEFHLTGAFLSDRGVLYHTHASYDGRTFQKSFSINKAPVEKYSSVIGQFPVVVLSPESAEITAGPPSERRKFVDFVIAQSSKIYLEDLLEYRRILKQRNKILIDAKISRTDCTQLLQPWDESLVACGARLVEKRNQFFREFTPHITRAYEKLVGVSEIPHLMYKPSVSITEGATIDDIRKTFFQQLIERRREERHTGATLLGPHRDEVELKLGDLTLRKFASQGQHKTFLIALKVAEFFYLKERCSETPILLLDDIFSELDQHRSESLLQLIGQLGQTFISTTDLRMFSTAFEWGDVNRKFTVRDGAVHDEKTAQILD